MRFLLNAASVVASARPRGASSAVAAATNSNKVGGSTCNSTSANNANATRTSAAAQQPQRLQKSWGQQCSPNCGCVVRYETVVDETTDRIVDVTYHAKSVLSASTTSSKEDGGLVPQLTQRSGTSTCTSTTRGRPILTECRCPTLHHLSSRITTYLKDRPFQQIYNTAEFSSVRSSPSFRRAVLAANGLGRGSTSCYDLVEEAFVACIKGYMPKPRTSSVPPQHYVGDRRRDEDDDDENDENEEGQGKEVLAHDENVQGSTAKESSRGIDLNPSRYADAARRAGRAFPPRRRMNGKMNVYKARDPVDNMPSYSLVGYDSRGEMEESMVSQYRPRSTVGAASQATSINDDGMPAFHISEEHHSLNEYEKYYDDELGGGLFPTASSNNSKDGDEVADDEEALLSDDWLEYIDAEINDKNENVCKEEVS